MDATSKKEKPLNPRAKANIVEIITHRYDEVNILFLIAICTLYTMYSLSTCLQNSFHLKRAYSGVFDC